MKKTLASGVSSLSILLFTSFLFLINSNNCSAINENVKSPFTAVYEKVSPSVVEIDVEGKAPDQKETIQNPWERFFNIPIPQEQKQQQKGGIGSGVIINRDGYIITNNHVVEDADKINVKLGHNEEYKASVVGKDPQTDIAVIKLELNGKQLPADYIAELGDSDSIKPGDYAIAIGNPVGLERTITVGIISAIGRYGLNVNGASSLAFQDFIQTDAQINPGNSGGALADINGKVIGINNMYTFQYAAIGFAIPINIAKRVADQLIKTGKVKRGFVGMKDVQDGSSNITKDVQAAMNLPSTDGFLVNDVLPGSPAEKAGLKHGDVIIAVDGVKVKDFHDFMMKISERMPGETIKLDIYQDGKPKTVSLTLADRDDFKDLASGDITGTDSWMGINVVDLSSQLAEQYGLNDIKKGVVVVNIEKGSQASDVNIKDGDVILEIQSKIINNIKDFEKAKTELKDSKKPILIYRMRKVSNGNLIKGYVAIKNQ